MAEAKPNAAEKAAPKKVKALSVRSLTDGFRRAGITFSKEAKTVNLSTLTKDQITLIKEEPLLAVTEIEVDAPAGEAEGAGE